MSLTFISWVVLRRLTLRLQKTRLLLLDFPVKLRVFIPCCRTYSQSEYWNAIIHLTVLLLSFPECAALILLASIFSIAWQKILMPHLSCTPRKDK